MWAVVEFALAAYWLYRAATWVGGAPIDTLSAVVGATFVAGFMVRMGLKDWRHATGRWP